MQAVVNILASNYSLDVAKITVEASFTENLGLDSLDTVSFIMELEKEFKIKIPDEKAEAIKTVGETVEWLVKALNIKH